MVARDDVFPIKSGAKEPQNPQNPLLLHSSNDQVALMIPSQLRYWCVSRLPETDATASASAANACCGRTHARKPLRCHHESLLECDFDISLGTCDFRCSGSKRTVQR